MAETHSKAEPRISKTERRYQIGYVSIRHEDRKTGIATHYSQHPSLHLKGDWLREAGFETGCPVTVRSDEGRLFLTSEQQAGGFYSRNHYF